VRVSRVSVWIRNMVRGKWLGSGLVLGLRLVVSATSYMSVIDYLCFERRERPIRRCISQLHRYTAPLT